MPDVLLLEKIHQDAETALVEAGLTVGRIDGGLSGPDLTDALAGVRVLGIRSKSAVTPDVLKAASSLEAVGCFCIGTNQVDLNAAAAAGTVVFNSPFSNTRSVAELTIAEIIALQRRLLDRSMGLHAGHWSKSATGAHEVRGRVLGIVGYGHIGSQVSVLAEALGMRVRYYDILPRMALGNAHPCDSLQSLLASADVVSLHVPATPATHHMIDAAAIASMKAGAVLINNARGTVVDLAALRPAIESGHIGGAALDVFPEEPGTNDEAFDCPLAGCRNVILTPHVGGSTEEAQAQIAADVATKLIRYLGTGTTSAAVNVPEVDLPGHRPEHVRILHFHHNVPGVLSALHAIIADAGANIHAEYLQSAGDVSYVILDIDRVDVASLSDRIAGMDETIRFRLLG
ncbi:MAG: phosphoglycerate dehydrogenase [Phycisphaerales bacterium]|jgi:D-3-phosphoglycerate dehydrogenase|nr:phosphoglycerate dehydrogenase [Phycisphaerales bacterium]